MNDLEEYFEKNQGRLIHKWMHYFEIYDRHFSQFRNQDVYVLEIGVNQGGSLQMWKDYFGTNAKIYGVDINYRCKDFEEEGIKIFIGSQEDRSFLKSLKSQLPRIDILIDDGGHTMKQQIITFEELFPHISENGVYLCEDLHTSYWANYGGGYRNQNSFIEYSKNFIDRLNAWHSKEKQRLRVDDFTSSAYSMHYYDSVLVIEKRKIDKPLMRTTGNRSFALRNQEVLEEAIASYRKAIELNPNNYAAYKNLGDALSEQGQQSEAIVAYQEAIKLEKNPAIYYSLGNAQRKQGDLEGAAVSYQQALELNSKQPFWIYPPFIYRTLGNTLSQQGKLDAALTAYQEAIKLEPENSDNYVGVGNTQLKKGAVEEAIASYRKAIELSPRNFAAYRNLGDALQKKGRVDEAISAYEKAIKLKPANPNFFYKKLQQLYAELSRVK
ncbi:MAG: tetratricopeptide repeat protein [Xenococcaceae cyanobacterium MO_188.B29]|nr:tetratricopeptide repeat protein [Xenococcaceae cyanobacterium MO_188.B29]